MQAPIFPTLLLSGTATGLRFATNATGALMDNCPAALITEIQKYERVMIEIWDGTAVIRAYTGAAAVGDGEDVGGEKLTNGNFDAGDTGWNKETNWTIVDQGGGNYKAVATGIMSTASVYQNAALSTNALYKASVAVSDYSAGMAGVNGAYPFAIDPFSSDGIKIIYFTAPSAFFGIRNVSGQTTSLKIDDLSVCPVTGPSPSGALLYNSAAMSVQSVMVNTFAAANYNKSSYTYKLWGNFKTSGRGGYVR